MLRSDRFIASCASWREFWEGTKRLSSTSEKGVLFERLTQLYLQTVPEYQSELANIWTLHEVPPQVRKLLALPALDEGIDFIAQTRHGKYWAIQSKFRSPRRFVPSIGWRFLPRVPSAPTLLPCACAFRRHSLTTAFNQTPMPIVVIQFSRVLTAEW